ncbi:protein kinase domain-containing protein [Novipirellula artificiosorum]|uniref:Serine/threonine-protein kinase PknB n=1 Tax=Novipirellula artificiosorum TaxID=2528016 RepID=A0A5C6DP24_9BACT|nr:protein kinase [Novipirellula artificiosorum]TWU37401.1 Serine/threonine-protein kinase PknB [Novipirellula artificiosorum]
MAVALSEFGSRLVRSGITDADGCKQYAAKYAKASGGSPPADALSLAKYLVRLGILSEFQAKTLLSADPVLRRIGPYLQREGTSEAPLSRWLRVQRTSTGRTSQERGFLFRVDPKPLAQDRDRWLATHAKTLHASLQGVELDRGADELAVFSALPTGKCLFHRVGAGATVLPRQACQIGISVCDALNVLHRASLVHGAVRSDRVWITSGSSPVAILLRDPALPPKSPVVRDTAAQDPPAWLDTLCSPIAYAAPEFLDPTVCCNVATDIYSLGCLLYRLVIGTMPFASSTDEQTLQQHASEVPDGLAHAVSKHSAGDPLLRVIAFAMAKNTKARFANVEQLSTALKATLPLLEAPDQEATGSRASVAAKPPSPLKSVAASVASPQSQPPAPPPTAPAPTAPAPAAPAPAARRRKRNRSKAPLVLGSLGAAVLVLVVALLARRSEDPDGAAAPRSQPSLPEWMVEAANSKKQQDALKKQSGAPELSDADAASEFLAVDDSRLLWIPPYSTDQPAPLRLLPPGPGAVLTVQLASLRSRASGKEFLDSLGPELVPLLELAAARGKVPVDAIDRLSLAMHPLPDGGTRDGWPEVSLAIMLRDSIAIEDLVERWEVAASHTAEGTTIYASDELGDDAYFVARVDREPESQVTQFAVGSIARMQEVAANEGADIPLPRNMQSLWDASSDQADFAIMVTPNFIFSDARRLLQVSAPKWVDPLKSLLIPNVATALLVADFDDERLYAETRFSPSGGMTGAALLGQLRSAVEGTPGWAETFILESTADPSWRLLANRLPSMMRFVASQTRYGLNDQIAIANVYVPAKAAPQLGLATLWAFNTTSKSRPSVPTVTAKELTLEELLDRKMSIAFDQESLEFGINLIVEQFADSLPEGTQVPAVRIVGSDLQKMGITQNQQIRDFSRQGLPFRQVLTDLLLGANPDKTATGSHDPKQALIWVVADDPQRPGKEVILVTTRQAVVGRYDLPAEFTVP